MVKLPVIFLSCLVCCAHAHESPSHSLEELNKHIKEKPTPELLFQRAMAYKQLGKTNQASADLVAASKAQPKHTPWQIELGRIELSANRSDNALRIANSALKLAKNGPQRAEIHILRAQAYQNTGKYKPSLHACQLAFREAPAGKIEWFLLRSENQLQLGLHQQRIQDLQAGLKKYPDTVLKPHWIDALIDAEKYTDALEHIENELPSLPWKSHWQVKQAQALIGLDRRSDAQKVLYAALQEIYGRLNRDQPDILLLADEAHIHILMSEPNAALNALNQLKKHRAPRSVTSRIEALISNK